MAAHQSSFCKTIYAICPVFDIQPLNEVLGCAPTLNGTRFALFSKQYCLKSG